MYSRISLYGSLTQNTENISFKLNMVSQCEILWIRFYLFFFYLFIFFNETNSLIQCSGVFRYKLTSAHDVMKLHRHFLEKTLKALFKKGCSPLPHPVLGTSKYSPHTHLPKFY